MQASAPGAGDPEAVIAGTRAGIHRPLQHRRGGGRPDRLPGQPRAGTIIGTTVVIAGGIILTT